MPAWQKEKDSGWSWLILFATFITHMITLGALLCFGLYFVVLRDYFQCSRQEVAGIGGMAYGIFCITGPFAGLLYKKFGCRPIVIAGGLISSVGLLISSVSTDRWHLYLSYGLLTGFGFGLAYTPSFGVLADYFEKYRFFATAFVSVGSAVGTLILSPSLLYLIDQYGWRGSMMITAGLALQLVVCGSLMKSRTTQQDLNLTALLELSLLKNQKFLLLLVHGFLLGGLCFVTFSMANSMATSRDLTLTASALLVSLMSATNGFGRLGASVIGHCPRTDRLLYFTVCTGCAGLGALAVPLCYDFVSFAFVLGWFGLNYGMTFSQMPGVAIDLFGTQKLVNAVGYFICTMGIGGVLIPPLAGRLVDQTNRTELAFILAGIAGLLAFGSSILVFIIRWREKQRHEKQEGGKEMKIALKIEDDTVKVDGEKV